MRRRIGTLVVLAFMGFALAACSKSSSTDAVRPLQGDCSDSTPCTFPKGTHTLKADAVIPGLQLKLPAGWTSTENDAGELNLIPDEEPSDRVFIWLDLAAVKSSGPGHGTTILRNVGRAPAALVSWLTHNPDFEVISRPTPTTVGKNVKVTSLALAVSSSARYGDSGCPSNPQCADFFTDPKHWGPNFYGIGGEGAVRFDLGTIPSGNLSGHTFIVGFEGTAADDLKELEGDARPIIQSLRMPKT